jgi:hypothetical protein
LLPRTDYGVECYSTPKADKELDLFSEFRRELAPDVSNQAPLAQAKGQRALPNANS